MTDPDDEGEMTPLRFAELLALGNAFARPTVIAIAPPRSTVEATDSTEKAT
jgi:hypothetical protein